MTRWPVSAARIAVSIVSMSRISPTRMTSGSWRSAPLQAGREASTQSTPISRCVMIECSSLVQVLDRVLDRDDVRGSRCRLMWSIIAASVVDLPLPVVPVTRTSPRRSCAMRSMTGGRLQLADVPDARRNQAQRGLQLAALVEDVDAEAAELRMAVAQVDLEAASATLARW